MKKVLMANLAVGLFVVGMAGMANATALIAVPGPDNINSFFGDSGAAYTVVDRSSADDSAWIPGSDGYEYLTGIDKYTGLYLGTVTTPQNDSLVAFQDLINYYLDDAYTLTYEKEYDTSPNFTVTGTDTTYGTWATLPGDPRESVEFYAIKASTEWAFYYVEGGLSDGFWSSRHLENPGGTPTFSHMSAALTTTAPVPEPATMLLFGTGLLGLAGARLRKKNK